MKLRAAIALIALMGAGVCLAKENIVLSIHDLKGRSVDYYNGKIVELKSDMPQSMVMTLMKDRTELNTGETTLISEPVLLVKKQLTFTFKAKAALWIVTCYPQIDLAFVNIHSDASEFGGAKMLSYTGKCSKV